MGNVFKKKQRAKNEVEIKRKKRANKRERDKVIQKGRRDRYGDRRTKQILKKGGERKKLIE